MMRRTGHSFAFVVVIAAVSQATTGCDTAPATAFAPKTPAPTTVALYAPTDGVLPFPDASFLAVHDVLPPDSSIDPVRATLLDFVAAHGGARVDTPAAIEFSSAIDAAS